MTSFLFSTFSRPYGVLWFFFLSSRYRARLSSRDFTLFSRNFFNKTAYRSLRDPTMRTVKFSSPHHMFLKLLHIQCCRFTPMWLIIARRLCHRGPFSHARLMTLLEYGTLKKVMIISVVFKVFRILCFTIWFLLCLILISWFCLRI